MGTAIEESIRTTFSMYFSSTLFVRASNNINRT